MFGTFGTLMGSRATAGATTSRDKPVTAASPAPICSKLRRVVDFVSGEALPPPICPSRISPWPSVDTSMHADLSICRFHCEDYTASNDHDGTANTPAIDKLYPDSLKSRKKFLAVSDWTDSVSSMIRSGFLSEEDRKALTALARDASSPGRVTPGDVVAETRQHQKGRPKKRKPRLEGPGLRSSCRLLPAQPMRIYKMIPVPKGPSQ